VRRCRPLSLRFPPLPSSFSSPFLFCSFPRSRRIPTEASFRLHRLLLLSRHAFLHLFLFAKFFLAVGPSLFFPLTSLFPSFGPLLLERSTSELGVFSLSNTFVSHDPTDMRSAPAAPGFFLVSCFWFVFDGPSNL